MGKTYKGKDKKKLREQYDRWHEQRFRRCTKEEKKTGNKSEKQDREDDDRY